MLPGGRYVLYHNAKKLECYIVAENRLVWMYVGTLDGTLVETYTAEMMDHRPVIVIIVGLRYEEDPSTK
jgi:hypothetical protein